MNHNLENKNWFNKFILVLICAVTYFSIKGIKFSFGALYEGFFVKPIFVQFIKGMYPMNWEILPDIVQQVWVTILCAWFGTFSATIIALPLSFFAARNIQNKNGIGNLVRLVFNLLRSIDVLIIALILVAAIGLGPLPGAIAICIHSIGSSGKLFTEAIENIDMGIVEAMESVGAKRALVLRFGVVPQITSIAISLFLYRLELNIRSSVILGIVGAGGIGFLLIDNIKQFQYRNVSMILFVIIILVMLLDWLSAYVRRKITI